MRDLAPPKEELSSLNCHSLVLLKDLTSFTEIGHFVIFRQQFKTFDPNNFTLSAMFSFQYVWSIYSFSCLMGLDYDLHIFKTTYLIFRAPNVI